MNLSFVSFLLIKFGFNLRLTFLPFEDPVCTTDGSVFELTSVVSYSFLTLDLTLILNLGENCRTIVPYIRKFGKHPVTGAPLKGDDLIPLVFHKNSEGFFLFFCCCFLVILICRIVLKMLNLCLLIVGEFHCPVLNKVFTEFSHIVAVKTTGNVFCYEVCLSFFY